MKHSKDLWFFICCTFFLVVFLLFLHFLPFLYSSPAILKTFLRRMLSELSVLWELFWRWRHSVLVFMLLNWSIIKAVMNGEDEKAVTWAVQLYMNTYIKGQDKAVIIWNTFLLSSPRSKWKITKQKWKYSASKLVMKKQFSRLNAGGFIVHFMLPIQVALWFEGCVIEMQ